MLVFDMHHIVLLSFFIRETSISILLKAASQNVAKLSTVVMKVRLRKERVVVEGGTFTDSSSRSHALWLSLEGDPPGGEGRRHPESSQIQFLGGKRDSDILGWERGEGGGREEERREAETDAGEREPGEGRGGAALPPSGPGGGAREFSALGTSRSSNTATRTPRTLTPDLPPSPPLLPAPSPPPFLPLPNPRKSACCSAAGIRPWRAPPSHPPLRSIPPI